MHVTQFCSYLRTNAFHARFFEAADAAGLAQTIVAPLAVSGTPGEPRVPLDMAVGERRAWSLGHKLLYGWKVRAYEAHAAAADLPPTDLVHAHTLYADGFAARTLADARGVPLVLTIRDGDIHLFPKVYPHWRGRARELLARADRVVFVNHFYRERLERAHGTRLTEGQSAVLPNGVDTIWLEHPFTERDRSGGIGHPRTEGAPLRIVCTGKLNPRKNQLALIEGLALARERSGLELTLDLVGVPDPRHERYARRVLARCEALDWCRALGSRTQRELVDAYADYDAFALASRTENFGIVYVEALLAGLPVLYTAGQGFDGWPSRRPYGVAVREVTPEAIAHGVLELIALDSRHRDDAAFAKATFDWAAITRRHLDLYRDATAAAPS